MRLALQTDYALRTLMYVAFRGQRVTATAVARFYGISEPHVAKVVNQLARLGFLRSVRGAGGGIELGRRPEDIRVGDVIRAFEGNLHLLECIETDDVCVIQPFCKLRSVLAEAEQRQLDYLNSVTLSDVLPTARQAAGVAGSAKR
jgi:Rrf2 family nitric oxide-sensitive transcriptional repressor